MNNFEQKSLEREERMRELRKKASEKIGRFASWATFDKDSIKIDDFDKDNPEKYEQDFAFATYETNLRESHYQDQKETREYYKDKSVNTVRQLGAYAMFIPGSRQAVDIYKDTRYEIKSQKARRLAYKQEHGTFISKTKEQWVQGNERLDMLKVQKSELNNRKQTLDNRTR